MEKIACYKHYVRVCLLEETSIWNTLKESVHPNPQKTYILKDIWNLSMEKPKLFAWWESWKAFFHVIWGNWPLNESRYSSHTEIQTCSSTWGNWSASVCFGCRKKSDLSTCTTYKASFQGIINVRNKWLGQMAMYSRSCKYAVTQLLEC